MEGYGVEQANMPTVSGGGLVRTQGPMQRVGPGPANGPARSSPTERISLSALLQLQVKLLGEVYEEVGQMETALGPVLDAPQPAGGNGAKTLDSGNYVDALIGHNEALGLLANYVRSLRARLQL